MILRLILGDQLNYKHSWFSKKDESIIYLIMEMRQETDYVMHHAQKVIGFFAAMYNFSNYLTKAGHKVIHLKINDPENLHDLRKNLHQFILKHRITQFEYQWPDEYRLDIQLQEFSKELVIPYKVYDTEHFLTKRDELANLFEGKKTYLMETFYRAMRKKHNIMMEGITPMGGKWNFDSDNRQTYKGEEKIPEPMVFKYDYSSILKEIDKQKIKYFGNPMADEFPWPTTRNQALQVLDFFTKKLLPLFGKYQDAMHTNYWSLYHSRLSFALNIKMISPKEVIDAAIKSWQNNTAKISIEQIEGFVRQILGWREYMRGIYWAKMPEYATLNYFEHTEKLPIWFWNGNTKLNCLKYSIKQSLNFAYAHHIQRLMVIGNFALLAGVNPSEVDKWYLGIYIDAIEWAEITNTRGMSQFADAGIVGSKPYVSSANYIDKMSNYCKTCYYDKSKKTGERACPFNSLYWNFYDKHTDKLSKNPRIGMMYNVWQKMAPTVKADILQQADYYLKHINEL
ncbi:MAG: cryptochrome/photolyase family protein [Bacteroidota bacterium]|nr:cryptochrome/photolyase family protein [Bacteroidota bacterium]